MTPRPDAADAVPSEPETTPSASDLRVAEVLEESLRYARERDYRGWDFGDGMSSRLLQAVPLENTYLNLAVQEAVKRFPANIRPLLLVEQRRNFQGAALFAMANQNAGWLHEHSPGTIDLPGDGSRADGEVGSDGNGFVAETRSLVEWLVENACEGYSGFCGTHQHELQHLDGTIGRVGEPDVVSTSYAVRALLRAKYLDPEYVDVARSAVPFVFEDLDYREVGTGAVINYHMNHPDDEFTINAGALGARLLLDVYEHEDDPRLRTAAERILDHVAELQTTKGGWYYRDPPSASHLSMDSHHNGFVIECFQRHAEVTGSDRYRDTLADALNFYRRVLFEPDGAPNFDEESAYPRDVHASAQGVLVFSYAEDYDFARMILEWALENFYLGDGQFFFRRHRFHDKRHVLMRWCVGWMAYAVSEYLRCRYIE